tara:strand:+ start:452 stop:937 length:486 start_codon:yes stop_codon:yes gene_type:complete
MTYQPQIPGLYQGNQVIINSDRLLFNAKTDSILLFSDKAIGFSTKGSIHFDTSPTKEGEEASKVIINSPNIYLGLESSDNSLPTEPAVLGNQLENFLKKLITTVDDIVDEITYNVTFTVSAAPGKTSVNPENISTFRDAKNNLKDLKRIIDSIKSENTKLV